MSANFQCGARVARDRIIHVFRRLAVFSAACLDLKAVLAVPLLGTGMERDVARGGVGVFTELTDPRVGLLPIDLVLARRERLADFIGIVIRQ